MVANFLQSLAFCMGKGAPMQTTDRIELLAGWLRETMRRRGLSAAGWGRAAGLADTTISRFLKKRSHMLRDETIAKLASAAGVAPPAFLAPAGGAGRPALEALSRLQSLVARREEVRRELARLEQMIEHHYRGLGAVLGFAPPEPAEAVRPLYPANPPSMAAGGDGPALAREPRPPELLAGRRVGC